MVMIVEGKVSGDFMLHFNIDGNKKQWRCVVKNLWLEKLKKIVQNI